MEELDDRWVSVTGVHDIGDLTISEYPGDDGSPMWTLTVRPDAEGYLDLDRARLTALRSHIDALLAVR